MSTATSTTILPPEEGSLIASKALIHLRLLFAFRKLRMQIGSQDGLWGIWDDRLETHHLSPDEREQGLAKLKEKRWSIYLARAVHRYSAWWAAMGPSPLTEQDTMAANSTKYATFTTSSPRKEWTLGSMIPLDVLMVWHTHMLNPRLYLEDTMRKGRGDIWASGLPWDLLASCFATDQFEYEVLETSRIAWTGTTGLSWDNVQDSMHVNVTCPSCRAQMRFPWTTSDFHYNAPSPTIATSSKSKSQSTPAAASPLLSLQERLNLIGHGLADGKPLQACQSCQDEVDADFLCFYKFIKDGHNLTKHRHCMPGTLLDPVTGIPELDHPASSVSKANAAMTVPNRLTREVLYPKANDMLWKYRDGDVKPTTAGLRGLARRELHECMTLAVLAGPQDSLSTLELAASLEQKLKVRVREEHRRAAIFKMISPKVRVIIRRMISQYTDNWSPFALDLRSAMLRQSLFIDKMYKFDWLNGVDPQATMERAVTKYARFLEIATENKKRMVVPTLDVDLAWHTHQLSPKTYYYTTTHSLGKFLDHDDKVSEDKLSESFEWMCETYYQKYGEIYSECVCWYCEVTRVSQTNTLSVLLGKSKRQKSFKELREQLKVESPSDFGPHLSAHNAVKTPSPICLNNGTRDLYIQYVERRKRAVRRAETLLKKNGHDRPPKEQHVDHWGYPYPLAGPWVCPLFFDQSMYTSSISKPPASSGINVDDNIGGCVTGCGFLGRCGGASISEGGNRFQSLDVAGVIADVHDLSSAGDGGGGDGGGCGGCGGGD